MLGLIDTDGCFETACMTASTNLLFRMNGKRNGSLEDDLYVWASMTMMSLPGICDTASVTFGKS